MKRLTVLLLACAGAVLPPCGGRPCRSQEDGKAEQTQTQAAEIKRMTGTVAKVSFVNSEIMVTGELGYITFRVPDKISIMRGTKEIDLDEINPGETVMVQYETPEPGTYVAVFLRASSGSE